MPHREARGPSHGVSDVALGGCQDATQRHRCVPARVRDRMEEGAFSGVKRGGVAMPCRVWLRHERHHRQARTHHNPILSFRSRHVNGVLGAR